MIRRDTERKHTYSEFIFKELNIYDIQGILIENEEFTCCIEAYEVENFYKIDLYFYSYRNIAYNQLGKNFIKNLSFLDLLFNLGKDNKKFIKKNFFLIKDKNI